LKDEVMERIQVLNLILGLSIGEPLGGAEKLVLDLVSALDRSRVEPIVCAFWQYHTAIERYWASYLEKQGIEVFFAADWHGKYRVRSYIAGARAIRKQIDARQIDLIHSHFQMGSLVAMALQRHLKPTAILRTAHASKEWGDGFAAYMCRQIFTTWVFPLVFDVQTANAQSSVTKINRYPGTVLAHRPAIHIPNGVTLDRFRRQGADWKVRHDLGISADDIVIGNVGRLSPEKGHTVLLQAAVAVCERLPNTRFLIVGDGALRSSLQRQSHDLGLEKYVVWAGARTDVEGLYQVMDIFVLPSIWEAFGIVIVESMASGVPIVASDLPGVRELIQPGVTGWLVEPGDPTELAACIMRAIENPEERDRIAHDALEQVVPGYYI
jgi:glycosyltransferase involved in cell wall biosynthesis